MPAHLDTPLLPSGLGGLLAPAFLAAMANFGLRPEDLGADLRNAWAAAQAGYLDEARPEGLAALELSHCLRLVARLVGPDPQALRRWAHCPSQALAAAPADLMGGLSGLRVVLGTLEPAALHPGESGASRELRRLAGIVQAAARPRSVVLAYTA